MLLAACCSLRAALCIVLPASCFLNSLFSLLKRAGHVRRSTLLDFLLLTAHYSLLLLCYLLPAARFWLLAVRFFPYRYCFVFCSTPLADYYLLHDAHYFLLAP